MRKDRDVLTPEGRRIKLLNLVASAGIVMEQKIGEMETRILRLEKWTEAMEKVLPEEQALEFFEAFVWKESQKKMKRPPQRGRAGPTRGKS